MMLPCIFECYFSYMKISYATSSRNEDQTGLYSDLILRFELTEFFLFLFYFFNDSSPKSSRDTNHVMGHSTLTYFANTKQHSEWW